MLTDVNAGTILNEVDEREIVISFKRTGGKAGDDIMCPGCHGEDSRSAFSVLSH